MKTSAYISGTSHPQRREWLRKTIDFMDQQEFPFEKKILTIDQFGGNFMPEQEIDYFSSNGWTVLVDSHMSRVKSLTRALNEIDSEYIFYNEDDVIAILPDVNDLETVFNTEVDGKKCGMITMTIGGDHHDYLKGSYGDLTFIQENTILESEKYVIFKRLYEYASHFFLQFPGLWIRSEIFKNCNNKAKTIGGQIENGLTDAYFANGYDKTYYKCSIARPETLEVAKTDPKNVDDRCTFLKNLDPRQGSATFGGGHHY